MDIIRFGTPEEAARALMEVQQRGQPKQLDQNAIVTAAENRILNRQAVESFKVKYADVMANPDLMTLVVALERQEMARLPTNQPVDWGSFYDKIGTRARNLVASRTSQTAVTTEKTASTTSQPSEKEARKASITVLPTASARAELPKEEKELSPDEERKAAIAAMKKSRGQG